MSKEKSIIVYDDTKTKTTRYEVNGVDITSSIEVLKEQFLNQWNNEHKLTTELSFYERNKYAKQISDLEAKLAEREEKAERYEKRSEYVENRFSELKQQLAEKDLRIEELESQFAYECECNKQFVECQKENENLKRQLAEKEREIENRLNYQKDLRKINDELTFELNDTKQLVKDLKRKQYQDKISFALEQLEKVKELVRDNSKATGFCFAEQTIDVEDFEDLIDNQINQLKEGK